MEKTLSEGISPLEKEIDSDYLGANLVLEKSLKGVIEGNKIGMEQSKPDFESYIELGVFEQVSEFFDAFFPNLKKKIELVIKTLHRRFRENGIMDVKCLAFVMCISHTS